MDRRGQEAEAAQGKAYEQVIRYVKGEILAGNLLQGQKLPPERELALRLGVGRNSVREALRTLDILGVISSAHGAGNFVSCNFEKSLTESMTMMFLLRRTDYREISELRQGIEAQAAMLAAERITPEQAVRLEETLAQLAASDAGDKCVALDKQLHYMVAQASQNVLFMEILQSLSDVMDRFIDDLRRGILSNARDRARLQGAHEGIVRGIVRKDKDLLARAVAEHFALIARHL